MGTSVGTITAAASGGGALIETRLTLQGVDEIVRAVQGRRDRMTDVSPAWPDVDEILRAIARQQFASEGAHGGEPWAPLAESTQDERRRLGYGPGHPILERTHRLERSVTGVSGDTITVHAAQYYAFGTAVEYAPFHQAGTRTMPRRKILQLTADDKHEVMRPITVYLRGGDPSRQAQAITRHQSTFAATTGGFQ